MRRRWPHALVGFAGLGVFVATSGVARATPTFPAVIASDLGLASPPPCTICHTSNVGGVGTATTPFAMYMRSRGLRALDEGSLRTALLAAAAERHDSNGDGTIDVDELKEGRDPNGGARSGPEYGCGRVARRGRIGWPGALAVVAALALGLAWRRLRSNDPVVRH